VTRTNGTHALRHFYASALLGWAGIRCRNSPGVTGSDLGSRRAYTPPCQTHVMARPVVSGCFAPLSMNPGPIGHVAGTSARHGLTLTLAGPARLGRPCRPPGRGRTPRSRRAPTRGCPSWRPGRARRPSGARPQRRSPRRNCRTLRQDRTVTPTEYDRPQLRSGRRRRQPPSEPGRFAPGASRAP
jgi:hypothetical protein